MDLIEKNSSNPYRHPWEISRSECLLNIIKKYPTNYQYADIGAGDLYFAEQLKKITNKTIYAVDTNIELAPEINGIVKYNNIDDLPSNGIDIILLMDVLEHIADDKSFLINIQSFLKYDGRLIITVPAHKYLFSPHDVMLQHKRRYNKHYLINILEESNLKVEEMFEFYTILFMIRMMQKILCKLGVKFNWKKGIGHWKFPKSNILTRVITAILNIDFVINYYLSRLGCSPWGLSICAICKKRSV